MSNILKYHLEAQEAYKIGQPVIIKFSIENLTENVIWILTWYTPFEGILGKIFSVNCGGQEIVYNGMMVKRGNPDLKDYLRIGPYKSVSTEVDLSIAYRLQSSNECHVKFKGIIHDFVFEQKLLPRKIDEHQSIDIEGNIVTFQTF